MIRHLKSRPECIPPNDLIDQQYYELSDQNGVYGYVATVLSPPECQIHFRVIRFSPSVLRSMDIDYPGMVAIIAANGGALLTVCYPDTKDKRMHKLLKRYGFSKPIEAIISYKAVA